MHVLHIFAKNRDAVAALKGYSYQQLKTLQDWIENRIAGGSEDIYCDYEDDILARDLSKEKTTFKQIKLYSVDFSFSSESVKKAIAHFFSMYVKGEYSFDQLQFDFETNVSVVGRDVKGNDADLLREWNENQDKISDDLLRRIRVRIKKILSEYIEERFQELSGDTELKSDLQKAKNVYDNLKDEDFDAFIRSIKWRFDGEEPNEAVQRILTEIKELIPKIPLPLKSERTQIYLSLLVNEVFQRSMQDDPEDRKLTADLMDSLLLNAGENEDKWYGEALAQFKQVDKVEHFYPGEFQTAVSAASYCRWNKLDEGHQAFWLNILQQYFGLRETPILNKRKAIYEYLFLKIGHDLFKERDTSPIAEDKELIHFYFDNWEPRSRVQEIEDDIVILELVKSQVFRFGLSIPEADTSKWEQTIKNYLDTEAAKENNVDRLCELIELQGHWVHQSDITDPVKSYQASFDYYRKIPPLLEQAQFYSLARLYSQMKQMVKMLTEHGLNDELLDMTDEFMKEIQPYAEKTGLRHQSARDLVERAHIHIGRHDYSNYIRALDLLHKAKSLWRLEHTKEGYILSLLGIAQVYAGLGMTYASKYYSLLAFWSTWHFADPKLYKHLQKALSHILHIDKKHGAWMNAIDDFTHYLFSKREFDEKGFEMLNDKNYHRAITEMAIIMHSIPLLHPEMAGFVETLKPKWGIVWEEHIKPIMEEFSNKAKDADQLRKLLSHKLFDLPLNDVGPVRNIRFRAMGNSWHIQFENIEAMTPIGEEFVSFLQVTLTEIARINPGILNKGKTIQITVKQGHFQKQKLDGDNWIVNIPEFDSKEQADIQMHYSYMGSLVTQILQSISNVSKKEFNQFYIYQLLEKEKLGEKALEASSYQRVLRNSIGTSLEETKGKAGFAAINEKDIPINYPDWLVNPNETE